MSQLTVPIVRTSAFPAGYCYPADPEEFFEAIVARIQGIFLNNLNGIIISATAPGADDRDKLWFNTNNGDSQLYRWETSITAWARKHPVPPGSSKRIWFPLESDLTTEDGGSAGAVSDAAGPFWERDTSVDGRFLLCKGTIPGTDPAITVNDGDTADSDGVSGSYDHALTEGEGGLGSHRHMFGKSNNAAGSSGDDAFFSQGSMRTVAGYSGTYITGSNGVIVQPLSEADLITLPSGDDGAGLPAPEAFPIMPPYMAGILAKRTARIFILPL